MSAKSKPSKRGGRRPGAGRKAGTQNRSTQALKDIAVEYTARAVKTLVSVMEDSDAPPAARVAAADKLLDRGHGRPTVTIEAQVDTLDPDLLARIKTEMVERMAMARERQRQVLLERGLKDETEHAVRH